MSVVRDVRFPDAPFPISICFCGHSTAEQYCDELDIHFSAMKQQGLVVIRKSHKIPAGAVEKEELESYMTSAHIIVLFISAYFFHECWDIMEQAMDLSDQGRVRVVPVLVSHVDYEATRIKKLQVLPRRKKPLAQIKGRPDRDEVYLEIVQAIREVIRDIQARNITEEGVVKDGIDEQPRLDDPTSYKARGDRFFQQQHYDQALAAYNEAISLDPSYIEAYRAREQVYRMLALRNYEILKQLSELSLEVIETRDDTQEGLER